MACLHSNLIIFLSVVWSSAVRLLFYSNQRNIKNNTFFLERFHIFDKLNLDKAESQMCPCVASVCNRLSLFLDLWGQNQTS